jgi:glycosyltransferase involved in cell wall biosynthesis
VTPVDRATPAIRRRLLFVAPFPPDLSGSHGGSRAIASIIDTLARRHDVSVLYLDEANGDVLRREPQCSRMIGIDMPIRRRSGGHIWSRMIELVRLLLGSPPDWVRESRSAEMAKACAELAGEIQPDVVHFEFHVMAQYIPAVRKAAPEAICIVTEHEPGVVSASARRQEGRGTRQRLASWIRRRAWTRYERRALSQADAVVTFTKTDEAVVSELVRGSSTQVTCIPLRILPERFGSGPPIESDLLFVGAFRHPPNVDAAMRLATAIFPRIREARPAARMAIVGPDPPPQLVHAAGPGIEVTGRVDDVAPYFAGASIFICPLRLGGGMRVKVLEACAFGKALIATSQAVEGLGLRPGIEFTLAASDDEFADRAIDLLSNAARREQLEQAALDWAARTQDPEKWATQYDTLYSALTMPASDREAQRAVK